MKNSSNTRTRAILIRRQAQTLDNIGQFRLRRQQAEVYGLWAVAEAAQRTIARLEEGLRSDIVALKALGD